MEHFHILSAMLNHKMNSIIHKQSNKFCQKKKEVIFEIE
jgi:hypothetical protein